MNPNRLVTPKAAAVGLTVGTSTLAAWRKNGTGPPFLQISPRIVRYRLADLEAWVASFNNDVATGDLDHQQD